MSSRYVIKYMKCPLQFLLSFILLRNHKNRIVIRVDKIKLAILLLFEWYDITGIINRIQDIRKIVVNFPMKFFHSNLNCYRGTFLLIIIQTRKAIGGTNQFLCKSNLLFSEIYRYHTDCTKAVPLINWSVRRNHRSLSLPIRLCAMSSVRRPRLDSCSSSAQRHRN